MNVKLLPSRVGADPSQPEPSLASGAASKEPKSSPCVPRKNWWQKSVVRRSTSSIGPDIDSVIGSSLFLQLHASDLKSGKGIAVFHRSEIETGRVLGTGGFSLVSEVTAFRLNPAISARCSPEERALRERYVKSATTGRTCFSRYCIKHLQERLLQSPKDFQVAASDLAVEATYLSALDHPNILSVRGLPIDGIHAWEDGQHDGYFIITDRLQATLEQRIALWSKVPEKAPALELKAEYAKQLADALQYLHEHRIIYRDTKPQNVGFSIAEDRIQLFDFGLCRELPPETEPICHGIFAMSGVGTRRYMAPEIFLTGEYNVKADVYSWALLFWEMLSLVKPYARLSESDHQVQVCHGKMRPTLDEHWPLWIRTLLRQSWQASVDERISMHQVWFLLKAKLMLGRDKENDWLVGAISPENTSEHQSDHGNDDDTKKMVEPTPISPTGVSEYLREDFTVPCGIGFESLDAAPAVDCYEEREECARNSPPATIFSLKEHQEQEFCTTGSVAYGSVEAHFLHSSDVCNCNSPPPAPKKPTAFLNLPHHVVRNIWLQQDLSEADEVSGIYSYDGDDSFACHSTDSMDCDLW